MKPPYAIGSVPSLSGHAVAYRWRSLPRVIVLRFPFSNFRHFFTLFSKFFASFPHGTCSLSVSHALCIVNELLLYGAHIHSVDPKLYCCYYCCTYFLAHAAAACLLHFSLSLYFSHLFCIFSTKNKLAKLKGLLRVQPSGRRKDEPQRGFISVRYYEV